MRDPDLSVIETIYDALDRGEPEGALRTARAALAAQDDADPVLHFLCGVALLELDAPLDAVDELRRAVELDPDDDEFGANLALALFRCCRFDEAAVEIARRIEGRDVPPDIHQVDGLLAERRGDLDAADRAFARASALDAERFPMPARLDREAFDRELDVACGKLPEMFRRHLDDVTVLVEDVPSEALLRSEDPPLDPELLGLFSGIAVGERSHFSPGGEMPPQIYLFKRNLERFALERGAIAGEIVVTLYHELGHYLGMDEEDLQAVDFA